jgi:hypothetical protein
MFNDRVGQNAAFGKLSSTFTTSGANVADSFYMSNSYGPVTVIASNATNGAFKVYAGDSSTVRLTILQTGAATFSGALTSTGAFTASSTSSLVGVATFSNAGGLVLSTNFTGTTAGGLGYDTTSKQHASYVGTLKGWADRYVYKMHTQGTLFSSFTTAQTILVGGTPIGTKTMPASQAVTGRVYRIYASINYQVVSGSTLTLSVMWGSSTLLSVPIPYATAGGKSGTLMATIAFSSTTSCVASVDFFGGANGAGPRTPYGQVYISTSLSTSASALDVFAAFDNSNANNSVQCNLATIEEC